MRISTRKVCNAFRVAKEHRAADGRAKDARRPAGI